MSNAIEKIYGTDELVNKDLQKYMRKLKEEFSTIQRVTYRVCVLIARIQDTESYVDDFETFENFGKVVFNQGKATMYNMAKVGREWTDGKGHSVLYDGEPDYSISQIYAIMRLKVEKGASVIELAKKLHADGVISPRMKVTELKEIVKAYNENLKPKKELPETTEEEETTEVVATVIDESAYDVMHTVKWLSLGNSFKLDIDGRIVDIPVRDDWYSVFDLVQNLVNAITETE